MSKAQIFLDYVPAELREGKEWMVVYYVRHPQTGVMKRIRIRVNRIKSITERRKFGKALANEINQKLPTGWNRFIEQQAPRAYTLLTDAFNHYLNTRGGAHDTMRTYRSIVKMVELWLEHRKKKKMMVVGVDKAMCVDFLRWIIVEREVGPRTYNNYLQMCKTIWNWFIEHQFCSVNPWNGFKKKRARAKTRLPIPDHDRHRISEWFRENNRAMYVLCALMFTTGIRRTEATKLKVGDINFKDRRIDMPADITKSGKARSPFLHEWMVELLREYVGENPRSYYLIGREWRPHVKGHCPTQITDWWTKMRNTLGLRREYQLYSLRDTGIQTMLNAGVPVHVVANQFGHSSLEITSKYTVHLLPGTEAVFEEKFQGF